MSSLDERYGRRRPVRPLWWVLVGASAAVIALVWMAWVTFAPSTIETRDISQEFNPERSEMTVTWSVTAQPGTPLACAVQALNFEFQVVGWKVVSIPPGADFTRQFTETFRTVMTPELGFVYSCWAS